MPTSKDFRRRSLEDRDAFWREQAALIDWQTPFTEVLDYTRPPFAKWFVGGHTNLCHNAIDRHLATRADQAAVSTLVRLLPFLESAFKQAKFDLPWDKIGVVLKSKK